MSPGIDVGIRWPPLPPPAADEPPLPPPPPPPPPPPTHDDFLFIWSPLELCGDESLLADTECSSELLKSSFDDDEYDSIFSNAKFAERASRQPIRQSD